MVRTKKKDADILEEALKRFKLADEADREERELALEDLRFVFDEDGQWTEQDKKKREGRPTFTFDKVSGALDQLVGDQLQSRPGIKVRPAEDGDVATADIYTGLIRNIEATTNAKRAYSNAFKFAAGGGFGAWMVSHDYQDEDSFDQNVSIEPLANPFCALFDPNCQKTTKCDGKFQFYFTDMDKDDFEAEWPKAKSESEEFNSTGNDKQWFSDDTVRVADYWRKVPVKKTIYMMTDGRVLDKDDSADILDELEAQGITIVRERLVDAHKIEHFKITGCEVLEESEYASKYFPIVPLYGKNINLEGKFKYRGIIRKAKDAQRLYNYEINGFIETVEQQPKMPYFATPAMIEGHEEKWQNMNTSNDPVMLFNFDQGNKPFREPPPQVSQAHMQSMAIFADNIKAQTGIYDASMGQRSNESSGVAIRERDRQGDTATFEFTNELTEALEHTGRILIDLIPKIIDTQRQIRILGEDDAEEVVEVNRPVQDMATGEWVTVNDLSRGKYDLVVTAGSSYSTKRAETAEQLGQIMAQNPSLGQMFADVYIKSLDLVGGDDVVKRIRKMMIQKKVVEPNEEEKAEMQQKAQGNQQAKQMKQAAQQLEMRAKQAEIGKDEADAKYKNAQAILKQMEAETEKLELAIKQRDFQTQQRTLMSMQGMMGMRR